MAMNHIESTTMTVQEHHNVIEARHEIKLREHMREQKLADELLQLEYLNSDFQDGELSTIAQPSFDADQDNAAPTPSLDGMGEFFFLRPISVKKRRKLLRSAGVDRIDGEEKFANRLLRESREICGCNCQGVCVPDSCECNQAGIQCQVDRESFPCGCTGSGCHNVNGRIEFNQERVRRHQLTTLQKLRCDDNGTTSIDAERSIEHREGEDRCRSHVDGEPSGHRDQFNAQPDECDHLPNDYLRTLRLQRVDLYADAYVRSKTLNCTPSRSVLDRPPAHTESAPVSATGVFQCKFTPSQRKEGQIELQRDDNDVLSLTVGGSFSNAENECDLSLSRANAIASPTFLPVPASDGAGTSVLSNDFPL